MMDPTLAWRSGVSDSPTNIRSIVRELKYSMNRKRHAIVSERLRAASLPIVRGIRTTTSALCDRVSSKPLRRPDCLLCSALLIKTSSMGKWRKWTPKRKRPAARLRAQ